MINIKELRIGNIIRVIGSNHEISVDYIQIEDDLIEKYNINDWRIENLEPIPLTEEWLFKLGFESMKLDFSVAYYIEIFKNVRFQIWLDGSCRMWYNAGKGWQEHYDNELPIQVKSVHQLQNLYHELTGTELIIKQ